VKSLLAFIVRVVAGVGAVVGVVGAGAGAGAGAVEPGDGDVEDVGRGVIGGGAVVVPGAATGETGGGVSGDSVVRCDGSESSPLRSS